MKLANAKQGLIPPNLIVMYDNFRLNFLQSKALNLSLVKLQVH